MAVALPPPSAALQQVPNSSTSVGSLNTSGSHFSSHSSTGLNVSASSFNNSKMDLDISECAESFAGVIKSETAAADASSTSLANLSTGSTGSSRNDSGIGIGTADLQKKVMLQLNNLDSSYDESALKKFLVSLLKPITPIVSLIIDGPSSAKIEVPSPHVSGRFVCL